ncbi:hypothetical protein GCM10010343_29730 [Streptomyces avidinii]|nr:hypothetical protein GCM10010343_29730 [Streptomyces avidinii]
MIDTVHTSLITRTPRGNAAAHVQLARDVGELELAAFAAQQHVDDRTGRTDNCGRGHISRAGLQGESGTWPASVAVSSFLMG